MVTPRRGSMKATACVYNTVMILLYHTVSPRFTSAGAVRLFCLHHKNLLNAV